MNFLNISIDFKISLLESFAIKGLAILLIMIHHFEQSCLSVDVLNIFKAFGPIGCSAFFFVSGYGLTVSKSEKNLKYWRQRILKIWIPFMLANIIYLIYDCPIGSIFSLNGIFGMISYIIGVKLINRDFWFLQALLFLYIGYAIATKLPKQYIYNPLAELKR